MSIAKFWRMLKDRNSRDGLYCNASYWDSKAEAYAGDAISMWPNNNLNRLYHQEQMSWLEKLMPDVGGKKVLDLGCGTGRVSRFLADRGAAVLGIDFSEKTIEVARNHSKGDNPVYRAQSVYDLNEEGQFDVAVAWGCLTVAARDRVQLLDALTRMRNSLKGTGVVLLLEPIHRGFLHRVLNMNIQEFCKVMEKAGFKITSVNQMHFWPMRLFLAFLPWPRWITETGYAFGQFLMRFPGFNRLGDYKVIFGTVADGGDRRA